MNNKSFDTNILFYRPMFIHCLYVKHVGNKHDLIIKIGHTPYSTWQLLLGSTAHSRPIRRIQRESARRGRQTSTSRKACAKQETTAAAAVDSRVGTETLLSWNQPCTIVKYEG